MYIQSRPTPSTIELLSRSDGLAVSVRTSMIRYMVRVRCHAGSSGISGWYSRRPSSRSAGVGFPSGRRGSSTGRGIMTMFSRSVATSSALVVTPSVVRETPVASTPYGSRKPVSYTHLTLPTILRV